MKAQALSLIVARQLNDHEGPETKALQHVQNAKVLSRLQENGWTILYVNTGVSDEAYLFYSINPDEQHFLALWAGSALPEEEHGVAAWEIKIMPHIPKKLASCFAWHVIYEGG